MKKMIAILLTLLLLLSLAACTQPVENAATEPPAPTVDLQAQKEAEEKAAIQAAAAEVAALIETADSLDAVAKAKAAYDALPEDVQILVINFADLAATETALVAAAAAELDKSIAALGEVTLENATAVEQIQKAYEAAPEEVKKVVKETAALEAAVQTRNTLQAAQTDALIDSIGKVTLKKEETIVSVQQAFSGLNDDAAALVTEKETLEKAAEKLEKLKKDAAFKKLKTKTDKKQGITWYSSLNEPKYAGSRSYVQPVIGVRDEEVRLYLRLHYAGTEWVFFENVTLIADGKETTYSFDYFAVQRANRGSKVWEWADVTAGAEEVQLLRILADAAVVTVRFAGDNAQAEIPLDEADKTAIRDVLAAYEYLK